MAETYGLRAVVFDLDGVLVSTSKFHARAWEQLVRSLGIEPPADLEERVKGISRMASLRIALGSRAGDYPEAELAALADRKNALYLELVKGVGPSDLFPGALRLFDSLEAAGIPIGLGSASKNARPVLESLGILDRFDAIADGFAYRHGKPRPDVFLAAARMLGADPGDCIVFEDAAAGITAALDGGFVAVGIGTWQSLKHAHLFIRSLEEVDAPGLRDLHARFAPALWTVRRDGVQPDREASNNTIFCVANGRIGIRGSIPELPLGGRQGTYLAGFYDRIQRPPQNPDKWSPFMKYWGVSDLARDLQIEVCIANCPDILDVRWRIDGEEVNFAQGKLESLARRLDMRSGVYTAEARWTSPAGRSLRLVQRRFADAARTERVFAQYEIEPLNFSGRLSVDAGIATNTANGTESGAQRLYDVVQHTAVADNAAAVLVRGRGDLMHAAFGTAIRLIDRPQATYTVFRADDRVCIATETQVEQGAILYVERVSAAAAARTAGNPLAAVAATLADSLAVAFNDARIESTARRQALWDSSDVQIDGSPTDQLGVRFSINQLLMAGSVDDPGVSIPAKALTSEGYRGMIFWDTDIYMTPFFDLTQPAMARNLAAFRCRTLAGARAKARRYGFRGASYPWETGMSGNEECEKWLKLITHQSHITADVAFALQEYVDCTGDTEFYEDFAAEALIETARFWVSKCVPGPGGSFSIPDAAGPDEYHVVADDSAYVNNLAIHNLRLADAAARHLRSKAPAKLHALLRRIGATQEEFDRFPDYAARINTLQLPGGLFEQCRGFFGLRDEIVGNSWMSDVQNTQSVKQADVMLLFHLLPDAWPDEVVKANWDYYERRTKHESSLSHAVHGLLALRLGLHDKAASYVRRSLGMDLFDEMGNAAGGAHMAAHGMNWVAIVRGYGGSRPQGGRFLVEPRLPKEWRRLRFNLAWRGADFTVDVAAGGCVRVANKPAALAPLPLRLCGRDVALEPGESADAPLPPAP